MICEIQHTAHLSLARRRLSTNDDAVVLIRAICVFTIGYLFLLVFQTVVIARKPFVSLFQNYSAGVGLLFVAWCLVFQILSARIRTIAVAEDAGEIDLRVVGWKREIKDPVVVTLPGTTGLGGAMIGIKEE